MGKFTRKATITLDVSVMDASRSSIGVRTRAKTLALQRLQPAAAPTLPGGEVCYLELRSRRLEKRMQRKSSRNVQRRCGCGGKPGIRGKELCLRSVIGGKGSELETEISVRGNDLDAVAHERGNQSSTITTPRSTTPEDNQRVGNTQQMNVPSPVELEEFFSLEEQSLQRRFIDKYNFDVVNDTPLRGPYDWVEVRP